MSRTPILITGCQRSGTTLLRLILNSHPDIMSIDEDQFDHASINTYMHAPWLPRFVAFKLPRYAPLLSFIRDIAGLRLIWCVRDPMDAVWSMVKLQMALDTTNTVAWAAHPACAQSEILNSYWILDEAARLELAQDMQRFQLIAGKRPKDRDRQESIFSGALCWKIKNKLPSLYKSQNIDFHVLKYETLVTEPADSINKVLGYIGATWNNNVLRHHELHEGVSIGNTANTRPIDSTGVGVGVRNFTPEEAGIIAGVCGTTAEEWDYQVPARE